MNSYVYHGNNVVYLNTNDIIIIRRALENRPLKFALPYQLDLVMGEKVNYGKIRDLLDGAKVIIGGSDD